MLAPVPLSPVNVLFQSTHPCWVRRKILLCPVRCAEYFNPRTRAGCDYLVPPLFFSPSVISIHAPVLGATTQVWQLFRYASLFQSTHPCWVRRLLLSRFLNVICNFNPRTRAGCDEYIMAAEVQHVLFQSTHPCWVRLPSLVFNV